ncbi:MAG: response regulator [Candidatus Rokuibacteriota bacterium]
MSRTAPRSSTICAPRGGWASALARERRPDLILLDRNLPDVPGDEVLRLLRAEPRTRAIPVVMLSADANPRHIQRLREAGATAYSPSLSRSRASSTSWTISPDPLKPLPQSQSRSSN